MDVRRLRVSQRLIHVVLKELAAEWRHARVGLRCCQSLDHRVDVVCLTNCVVIRLRSGLRHADGGVVLLRKITVLVDLSLVDHSTSHPGLLEWSHVVADVNGSTSYSRRLTRHVNRLITRIWLSQTSTTTRYAVYVRSKMTEDCGLIFCTNQNKNRKRRKRN